MRTSILFSHKRDVDLIALYKKVGNSEFSNMIKDALRSIIRSGYKGKAKPETSLLLKSELNEEDIRFNLILTAENDEDVRELLSHVLPKMRSTFIKQALRFYLGPVTTLSGFMDAEFAENLQSNPIPIQVFSIGNVVTQTIKPKKKAQRQRRTKMNEVNVVNKEIEIAAIPNISSSFENTFSSNNTSFPTFTTKVEENVTESLKLENNPTTEENTNKPMNEEDEMLAMLEGLLG